MKIERINENQIRCTLTSFDLSSRNLNLGELAYGSEKARGLFREMIQKASNEVGFDAEDIPLMVEAIPLSGESVMLVITKIEDHGMTDSSDSQTSTSTYPFYVNLDSSDGLMLGQHVYIEMDEGQESQKTGIWLSEVYIVDADTDSPYVWAADKKGKLEKRSVILGQHDEELGEYEIADGLSKDDCIAYPSDILEEGMSTTTNIEDAMDTGNIDMQPLDDSSFSEDPLPDTADTEGVSEYEMSDDGTVVDDPEAVDDSIVDDSSSDESMNMTDGSSDSGEILDDNLMPVEEDTEEAQ